MGRQEAASDRAGAPNRCRNRNFDPLKTMKHIVLAALFALSTLVLPARSEQSSEPSILDVALSVNEASGEFSTLIAAVEYAGLAGALDARRHYTVFAPTDAAFAELGLDATSVTGLPVEELTAILLYHLAPGDRFAENIVSATRVRMINKGFTFPSVSDQGVFINDAQVIMADIDCRNGVVHVIDTVLMP